jgi:hypothetical protein
MRQTKEANENFGFLDNFGFYGKFWSKYKAQFFKIET